jgi:alanyl-tRNA synthetase
VRVVSIGAPVAELLKDPTNEKWRQFSVEFCGGTHLKNTGDVEGFVITSEESVSKGVRRLVALTGLAASAASNSAREIDQAIAKARSVPETDLAQTINALQKQLGAENLPLRAKRRGQAAIAELQAKQKTWEKSQQKSAGASIDIGSISDKLLSEASPVGGGGKLVVAEIAGANDDQLRAVMDSLRKKQPTGLALMLASSDGTKVSFCAAVADDLIAKGLKAGDWIRETAKVAGGGGGGRPQMAQAGGKDPSKLGDALARAKSIAQDLVK